MYRTCCQRSNFPNRQPAVKDCGPAPYEINIEAATVQNTNFRTVLWTGKNLQVVLMSLRPGEEIGMEIHPTVDQLIRIEEGCGIIKMGTSKDNPEITRKACRGDAIMVPCGTWHNLINTGKQPLKLYTVYAPPEHPRGAVQKTKAETNQKT